MNQLTEIILKAGLLPLEALHEIKRWGMPVEMPPPSDELAVPHTAESISRAIADALEGEGYILTRETDLGAIPSFLNTMKPAVLHMVMPDGSAHDIDVHAGLLDSQWLLPWRSDSITDLLTNGETYLRFEGKRFFFKDARELFYGRHKAFVVCTTSTEEVDDTR